VLPCRGPLSAEPPLDYYFEDADVPHAKLNTNRKQDGGFNGHCAIVDDQINLNTTGNVLTRNLVPPFAVGAVVNQSVLGWTANNEATVESVDAERVIRFPFLMGGQPNGRYRAPIVHYSFVR